MDLGCIEATQESDSEEDDQVSLSRRKRARLDDNQREPFHALVNAKDKDNLPSPLEEAIKRGGELTEKVIIVDNEDEEVQEPDEPMNKEAVPDQGAQQLGLPIEAPPSPSPIVDD